MVIFLPFGIMGLLNPKEKAILPFQAMTDKYLKKSKQKKLFDFIGEIWDRKLWI